MTEYEREQFKLAVVSFSKAMRAFGVRLESEVKRRREVVNRSNASKVKV